MRRWLVRALAACIAFSIVYIFLFHTATVRYRLTLEARVDDKPAVGSGVIEVSYGKNPQILGARAELKINVRGEAVGVDLGPRGMLFALLKEGDDIRSGPDYLVLRAFGVPHGAVPSPVEKGLAQIRALSGKVEIPFASLPLLVRFRDINDPKTVERVDPNDLAKSFGAGVKLMRATMEIVPAGIWPLSWYGITGEPITSGIARKLPWLGQYYGQKFDGQRYETLGSPLPLANSLSAGAFKT